MKEITLSLINNFSWPLVILVCLFTMKKEISKLLSRLNTFKAGSVELQMSEQLHAQGLTKEQLITLGELSVDELDLFLLASFSENLGFSYQTTLPPEIFKKRLLALAKAGLFEDLETDDGSSKIMHNLTPMGKTVRVLLLNGSIQLLRRSVN
ncbi:hypothetical protein [Shewanella frigidimarina]|uniref:hypothetical protein n=1 Tax=Shewanella frigidimarina TaxID=56812 RepID=UPI003D7A61CA